GVRPGIKWPNDLVLNRKKLCGILTELEWEAESGEFSCVIIGAGINVSQDEADFGPEVAPIAISLAQALGTAPDRTELAAQVIRSLNALYDDFPAQNAAYLDHFRRDCLTVGNPIKVISGAEERIGTAMGISDDFGLTVRWEDGSTETLTSGEVSVRGLYDYV
uniref:biotin--[acetyl-CoA-carboxylase] ligase n=1 Tax=Dysosmobacter sp. TaxID=2591382 RepID=UPI003AB4CD39